MYRWKLAFDAYKDSLPAYYNDYVNSFIKFLQMSPQLLLPTTDQRLFEGSTANRQLHSLAQDLKHKQKSLDASHEAAFREWVQEHIHESFIQPKCCKNLTKSERQFTAAAIAKNKVDEADANPKGPYLSRINTLAIRGGSNPLFELSSEPNELLGSIFWQLKRIKVEQY